MAAIRISRHLQNSLMGSVIDFLLEAGVSDQEIRLSLDQALKKSRRKTKVESAKAGRGRRYLQNGDLPADLLRMWHRDSRYINNVDAKPSPLPLSRGKNSIQSMAQSLDPKANMPDLLRFLIGSGLVYKVDSRRYLPATDAGAITRSHRFVGEHVVKSIIRFMNTVRRNTSLESDFQPLLERFAYVSDLRESEIGDFCEFTKSQGHSYLQVVDDWMEQRRIGRGSSGARGKKKGLVAGVHVIAYIGGSDEQLAKKMVGAIPAKGSEGSDGVRRG